VDVVAALPSHAQPAVLVKPGDRALDDPPLATQARAVWRLWRRDHRRDVSRSQLAMLDLGPVRTVSEQPPRAPFRASTAPTDRRDRIDEADHLGDVVAVRSCQRRGERNPTRVSDQVVLGASAATVHRGRPRLEPPKTARTCEESITARDQSIRSA